MARLQLVRSVICTLAVASAEGGYWVCGSGSGGVDGHYVFNSTSKEFHGNGTVMRCSDGSCIIGKYGPPPFKKQVTVVCYKSSTGSIYPTPLGWNCDGAAGKFPVPTIHMDTLVNSCSGLDKHWPPVWRNSESFLNDTAWSTYFKQIYGKVPATDFQYDAGANWVIYDSIVASAKVTTIPDVIGTCPKDGYTAGQRYTSGCIYEQPGLSFVWHPYPYTAKGLYAQKWFEVIHQADPFGDEHFGAWFQYAPGSGIYFNVGNTMAFPDHQDAYTYFNIVKGNFNEELSKAVAAAGYDSIQFLSHVDPVSYPCDTKHTGVQLLDYMGHEILGAKLVGTYACTTSAGAPSSIRSGWMASTPCVCSNKHGYLNCHGLPAIRRYQETVV